MRPTTPGQPRRPARLARALGLDGNPLRRPTDRAEAWIRIGLLTVFLVAAPLAALAAFRLTLAFLNHRRLCAWESAWSKTGPHWTGRTS